MTTMIWTDLARALAEETGLERNYLDGIIKTFAANYAVDVWGVPNVVGTAMREGYPMSDEEARNVLSIMEDKVDDTIGMNWDVLSVTLETWWSRFDKNKLLDPDVQEAMSGHFLITGETGAVIWQPEPGSSPAPLSGAVSKARSLADEHEYLTIWSASPGDIGFVTDFAEISGYELISVFVHSGEIVMEAA